MARTKREAPANGAGSEIMGQLPTYESLTAKRTSLLAEVRRIDLLMHALEQMAESSATDAAIMYGTNLEA